MGLPIASLNGAGQSGNGKGGIGHLQDEIAAGIQRGTSGYHIVHQQYMLSFQCLGVNHGKTAFHILPAARALFSGLRFGTALPDYLVAADRQVQYFGHALAQNSGLVVAPLALFGGKHGQGHQAVNAAKSGRFQNGLPHDVAHVKANIGMALVF
jgi:hypothetical protein